MTFRHGGHRGGGWQAFATRMADKFEEEGLFERGVRFRGRVLDSNGLRLVLLSRIAESPAHGYELIKAIEEMTGGAYAPSAGMVYPLLTLLADQGLVEEQADASRKRYAITESGRTALTEEAEPLAAALDRLERVGHRAARAGASPVRRAMKNVEAALAARMGSETDRDLQLKAAAVLDEAAQKIERL
ncbi:PadR family transcriptional regulator [Polymorphobacter multimanifer]|uniref:DNA-binding PadR family transcriptional regulator n=1 Tax=Polymorphobacter multimanifer TaxID=1070431 RepID=A0A841LHW4_9SPHN|nr:PadR family transcriptional regulator [Polymorphobacter multimanifer]MBB6228558.1 DNA-binding PadR family transcriptional regulator [Polymorphobacter multimanifer]GGI75277.1 PadR family transcriptional regulator [Polymorphobacter multimanifer]